MRVCTLLSLLPVCFYQHMTVVHDCHIPLQIMCSDIFTFAETLWPPTQPCGYKDGSHWYKMVKDAPQSSISVSVGWCKLWTMNISLEVAGNSYLITALMRLRRRVLWPSYLKDKHASLSLHRFLWHLRWGLSRQLLGHQPVHMLSRNCAGPWRADVLW